ncbi:MAG: hypothetical protein JNJ61_26335, partial [Anaerolineae bacterium]|nr:hypothetical protein [Anaerolineae bacterium]
SLPARDAEVEAIRAGYGDMVDTIVREHLPFLNLSEQEFDQLKHRIVEKWDAIQEIAQRVPPPETIIKALDQAGTPTTWQALGLDADEVQPGFEYGHYLRNRFTVLKLSRILGLPLG